jgi:hypothetical protein
MTKPPAAPASPPLRPGGAGGRPALARGGPRAAAARPRRPWAAALGGGALRGGAPALALGRGALRAAAVAALGAGCAAIYPEVRTPERAPLPGQTLQPPPGPYVVWVTVDGGEVPARTRDGRRWRESASGAPSPFALVFVNGRELMRTGTRPATFAPRWADAPRGNYRFNAGDRVRVEMWDAGLVNRPICVQEIGPVNERWADEGRVEARCPDGSSVELRWEPAHGRHGYGFGYEFRTYDVFVSRVLAESPAGRAGLRPGDQLVALGGRPVKAMKAGEVQSYLNAPRAEGVRLGVKRPDGTAAQIDLKEGAIYPLVSEVGPVP